MVLPITTVLNPSVEVAGFGVDVAEKVADRCAVLGDRLQVFRVGFADGPHWAAAEAVAVVWSGFPVVVSAAVWAHAEGEDLSVDDEGDRPVSWLRSVAVG